MPFNCPEKICLGRWRRSSWYCFFMLHRKYFMKSYPRVSLRKDSNASYIYVDPKTKKEIYTTYNTFFVVFISTYRVGDKQMYYEMCNHPDMRKEYPQHFCLNRISESQAHRSKVIYIRIMFYVLNFVGE